MSEFFDPLFEERVSPTVTVPRDGDDNPLVIPRGGTEAIPYTRASSMANYLKVVPRALAEWRARYEAQGIAKNRDLAARIAAVHYSTGPITGTLPIEARKRAAAEIDAAREEAAIRAGINEAANMGTAGHSLTEPGSAGEAVEEALIDVVAGYNEVTAGLERVGTEIFVVNDVLRAGGTFDSAYLDPVNLPGWVIIGDTKTGKNYHQADFECQLAIYQGGELYLGEDGGRLTFEEAFGLPVNADVAYLVHVSVTGAPKPRIVKLDLARGRRFAATAALYRDISFEMDHVGIGEKLDHKELANLRLGVLFEELLADWDQALFDAGGQTHLLADADQAHHHRAQELYQRFKPYWTQQMTDTIKGRLS